MRLSIAILPLLGVLAGCAAKEPGVFDMPAATALERLTSGNLDEFRDARQCGILIHFRTEAEGNLVRWVVTSSGADVASFAARLTPLDDGRTKVTVEIPSAPEGGEIYDGKKTYLRPALMQPLRPAVEELVAARLEQRPLDARHLPPSTDGICDTQRNGLEAGVAHWRYDGNDGQGMGYPADKPSASGPFADAGSTPDAAPGQPTASAKPMTDARPMTEVRPSQ